MAEKQLDYSGVADCPYTIILVLQYMAIPKNKKAVRIKHILILTEDEFVIILNLLAKQCFLFENIFCIIRCYPF